MLVSAAVCVISSPCLAEDVDRWSANDPTSRTRFVEAIGQVTAGMTRDEVRTLLGEPPDIRTQYDPRGLGDMAILDEWCYGTDGHLSMPTLGVVRFGRDQLVLPWNRITIGPGWWPGRPPPAGWIDEGELRHTMQLIDRIRGIVGIDKPYDPTRLVAAVNALLPLGKAKSLDLLQEYLRVAQDGEAGFRVMLISRVLFDPPADPQQIPKPFQRWADFLDVMPRYPIVIVGDLPLLQSHRIRWGIGGINFDPGEFLDFFRVHGVIRSAPLVPGDSLFDVYDEWVSDVRPRFAPRSKPHVSTVEWTVKDQLVQALNWIHRAEAPVEVSVFDPPVGGGNAERDRLKDAGMRWDPTHARYTFADGSVAYPEPPLRYRRELWELPIQGRSGWLMLERKDDRIVDVSWQLRAEDATLMPDMICRIHPVDEPSLTLAEVTLNGSMARGRASSGSRVGIEYGRAVRVQLLMAGNLIATSPVLEPWHEVKVDRGD